MAQDVHCFFHSHLLPNESKFYVDVPRRYKEEGNRTFSFVGVNLVPDYFSKEITAFNIDPKEDNLVEQSDEAVMDFQIIPNMYSANMVREYTHPNLTVNVADLMKNINNHFDLNRPPGVAHPGIFFDWIFVDEGQAKIPTDLFYSTAAMAFYEEEFDKAKHYNALPLSVRNIENVNNNLFPTTSNPTVLSKVRIRMWIGPNVQASFTNEKILTFFGYKQEQIGERGAFKRFHIANHNTAGFAIKRSFYEPETVLRPMTGRSTISLAPLLERFTSSSFLLKTTKMRQMDPVSLAEDYNKCISEKALTYNILFGLDYDKAEKRFSLRYPVNDFIRISIKLPARVAKSLGFGEVELLTNQSVSKPIVSEFDVSANEDKARSLTFDTGMVIITLDHLKSNTTSGVQDMLMGALYPQLPGVLVFDNSMAPKISLPYYTSRLGFSLSRFKQSSSEPVPLGWSEGAYVYGHLVGKV